MDKKHWMGHKPEDKTLKEILEHEKKVYEHFIEDPKELVFMLNGNETVEDFWRENLFYIIDLVLEKL